MLIGNKVLLRAMDRVDAPLLMQYLNDPLLREMQCNPMLPTTFGMVERSIAQSGTHVNQIDFTIVDRVDNQVVGFVHLTDLDWISRNGQLGILIGDPARQGKGLGSEAMTLLVDYAFSSLALHRVWLRVLDLNQRALSLYDRLGFQREGVLKGHVFRQGGFRDVILLAILRGQPVRTLPVADKL
ncbi:MAG: GNAT family N-acetyltransferase [Magnetococcales bacterium]|nr:GNAT family N-acetyltransferase [Magnetococcales bacterium]